MHLLEAWHLDQAEERTCRKKIVSVPKSGTFQPADSASVEPNLMLFLGLMKD